MKHHNGYPITWNKFSDSSTSGSQLVALGAEEQRNIGIFSQNKPECLFTDFAAFANRLVTAAVCYQLFRLRPSILSTMLRCRFLFVGEQFQYDAAFSIWLWRHSLWRNSDYFRPQAIPATRPLSLLRSSFWGQSRLPL